MQLWLLVEVAVLPAVGLLWPALHHAPAGQGVACSEDMLVGAVVGWELETAMCGSTAWTCFQRVHVLRLCMHAPLLLGGRRAAGRGVWHYSMHLVLRKLPLYFREGRSAQ